MSQSIVRTIFESTLNDWASAEGIPVAWENVSLTPEPDVTYLRAFMLWAPTIAPDVSARMRSLYGIFQVSVVAPQGTGPGAAEDMVAAIGDLFPPTQPMRLAGVTVWMLQPMSQAPAMPEADRFVIPCSVQFQANYTP
jgi:hypothetical protein